jgi:glycerophosphoryl diester phosphodiesterase
MTLITAHSGCMSTPLNSIQGVVKGLQAGADIIEVDVRATKDNVVVLFHDEHLSTRYGQQAIRDLTFQEIQKFNQEIEEVVRLDEVLPIIREHRRIVNLDVKEDNAVLPLIQTVELFGMRDDVIITGCEKERATYIKDHYRPYQVLLNASTALYAAGLENYDLFVIQICRDAIAASCCGINIHYHFCREPLLQYSAKRCLPVLVWTIDDSLMMQKILDMGVHSITSNEVDKLVALKNKTIL